MRINIFTPLVFLILFLVFKLEAQNRLYWTNPTQGITSSNLDGSNVDTIFNTKYYGIDFFDIDNTSEDIFWQDQTKLRFGRSNLNDGSSDVIFDYEKISLAGLQYNEVEQKLYLSDRTNQSLIKMNKDGTAREFIKDLEGNITINRFDFTRNIHFAYGEGHLMKSTIRGTDKDTIMSFNSVEIMSRFIVDEINQKLFIVTVDYSAGFRNAIYRLYQIDFNGLSQDLIYTDNTNRIGLFRFDIDPFTNRVYFLPRNSELFVVNYDGTDLKRIALLPSTYTNVKIYQQPNSILGFYFNSSTNITRIVFDLSNIDSPIKVSEEKVFDESIIRPSGIAFDEKGKKIYWTDTGLSKISRANTDGTEIEVLTDDVIYPSGIALDLGLGKMFWTDRGDNSAIFEANFDGSQKRLILNANSRREVLNPEGIALDTTNKLIYFTSQGTPSIYRADYEGAFFGRVVTTNSLVRNISLDLSNYFLYWAESSSFSGAQNGIYRIEIGDTDKELIYQSNQPTIQGGIALDADFEKIYWRSGQQLQRINFDGTKLESLTDGLEEKTNRGYLTAGATHAYLRSQSSSLTANDKDSNGDGVLDITDPCACNDILNITKSGANTVYFHDVLTICRVVAMQNIYLTNNTDNLFLDKKLNPVPVGTNLGMPNGNGCVVYDFWHASGKQADIAVQSSAGPTTSFLSSICYSDICIVKIIIPTMNSWGIFIFGLLILNMGLLVLYKIYSIEN